MRRRWLRWAMVLSPALLLIGFDYLVDVAVPSLDRWPEELIGAVLILAVVLLFSKALFKRLDALEAQRREHERQLSALIETGMTLNADLTLDAVLQKVVDASTQLVRARYGALGVVGDDGYLKEFVTTGVTAAERARIAQLPRGHGLLGAAIRERKPLRVADMARDPRTSGFPRHHPHMKTLLAAPIISKGQLYGNLYLSEKADGREFTASDEAILVMFAAQAAIAIQNARPYAQTQDLAVLRERERIGMDLHDGIIQSLYAVGLGLEETAEQAAVDKPEIQTRLDQAIDDITTVIKDIRNYILDLRPQIFEGKDLNAGLADLVNAFRANSLVHAELEFEMDAAQPLSPTATVHLLHIAREALMNVAKHARASAVTVRLTRDDGRVRLEVQDNGVGFDAREPSSATGQGLRNIADRAQWLHGQFTIQSAPARGTQLVVEIPSED
ncbi:MAG: GAF domain-containing sensor histidine kinase [Chloroflexi bacterium]|nr:GAF domain-containing sensor histidine kinase [Chloroflexota bacterium]